MRIRRPILLATLALPVLALAPSAARAQSRPLTIAGTPASLDAYYARYSLEPRSGDRIGMYGIGARATWRPGAAEAPLATDRPLASRVGLGLFTEYAPDQDEGFRLWHLGVHAEVTPFAAPLFGRVEPVLGLGGGALTTRPDRVRILGQSRFAMGDARATALTLTPTIGANVGLWRGLGVRIEGADVATFRSGTLHNFQLAAGVTLPF